MIGGGAVAEAVAGVAAVVLAILGLASIETVWMVPIATIAVGAALAFEGAGISARFYETSTSREPEVSMSAEFAAGAAGIVLGVLALCHLAPMTLSAIAVLVYGAALLLGTSGFTRESEGARGTSAASGTHVLCGLAASVLGILALCGINPVTLTLVGLLIAAVSLVLSGGIVSAKMASFLSTRWSSRTHSMTR
jgi:hypothetical protein